jgi:acetyltransferase
MVTRNLFDAGFKGPILPVNPSHQTIANVPCYANIESLPQTPDLAVIVTPAASIPKLIDELGARGTRAAVVISAGFGEDPGKRGKKLQEQMLEAAQRHELRVIGPNCVGMMVPGHGLNASFSHIAPNKGSIAFIAQSGAIVTSILDWSAARGIGFSQLTSLGDMADVDFGDLLDYLSQDYHTRAILLYIEAITHARKFMSAARAVSRIKPVIVVKAGRHAQGARAALSHTGALAGSDAVYDMAFRRAGMLRVLTLEELFDAVQTLALSRIPKGNRLAILTNGGGIGVLATDDLVEQGGRLSNLSKETTRRLNEVLPPNWSKANPVDIIGDAPGSRYADALRILAEDKGVDATLVLNCPTAAASTTGAAEAIVGVAKEYKKHPILTSWAGEQVANEARQIFTKHRIPTYLTPEQAVRAFAHLADYRLNQELLIETPPSLPEVFTPNVKKAHGQIGWVLTQNRRWLTQPETTKVLTAYGIPVVESHTVKSARKAADIAAQLGVPVALKIVSPDITHRSDVGGVILNLSGAKAVKNAASAMLKHVKKAYPEAVITGFTVQPMIPHTQALELIAGMIEDPHFGPVILFGQGGTAVEVINDKALGLPPLNMRLAREIMAGTRIYRLLKGYRDVPGANLDAIALTLIRISQLVIDHPEIVELDINPLLADANGVIALDARIRVEQKSNIGDRRLAIRPYPTELEEDIHLGDGRTLLLRPILPEDEPELQTGFTKYSPEEIRLRFFVPINVLTHVTAARFTQIDYDREMALILTEHGIPGKTEIYGTVRIIADPDNEKAEYALIIRKEMTGMGLGIVMMRRILDYARSRGIKEIYGDVLSDNRTMLRLCGVLGFSQRRLPDDPGIVRVTLKLSD